MKAISFEDEKAIGKRRTDPSSISRASRKRLPRIKRRQKEGSKDLINYQSWSCRGTAIIEIQDTRNERMEIGSIS